MKQLARGGRRSELYVDMRLRVPSAAAAALLALVLCAACGRSSGHETADASSPNKDATACTNCNPPADGAGPGRDSSASSDTSIRMVADGASPPSDGASDGAVCDGCNTPPATGTPAEAGGDGSVVSGTTASVLTYHNDNQRSGQNPNETVLTPSNVTSATFGKIFAQPVDSYVYAQPLFVPALSIGGATHDVVFVVTEANSVYAFDANATGPVLWHTNVGTALSCSDLDDCGDLVPGAGITGTPVIDPTTLTMYLVALSKDSMGSHHRLHALDLTTGGEKFGGPVEIAPTVAGTGANSQSGMIVFDPSTHYQRCALLLVGGVVYVGIGGNAESDSNNHGWLLGFQASTLAPTMTLCTSPNDQWSSLWQTGGGPAADSAGFVYADTANGTFDVNTGGSDYGDTALKVNAAGAVVDYFTPHNQAAMTANDIDFGAANPLLLPDQSGAVAHELIAAGKPGVLYLVNRDNMGHYHAGSDSQIVQSVSAFPNTTGVTNGIFMSPAYWNGRIYVAGIGGSVESFALNAGMLASSPGSQSPEQFGFPGATASVSANGTSAGIVWALDGGGGVLYAYDATNLATELYNTTQASSGRDTPGQPVKFAVPTVAGGHVFVGTQTELDVYGLLP